MNLHCPCCHAQFSVEAIIQDEAARELLGLKADLPPATFSYLSLFRSEKRALSWERALRLAREIAEIGGRGPVTGSLNEAMMETVEALRGKGKGPLKNHNYLKRVMESRIEVAGTQDLVSSSALRPGTSKTDAAINSLDAWHCGDWVRIAISSGLAGLLALRLENSPAADTITKTADIWEQAIRPKSSVRDLDEPRITAAFRQLFPKVRKWPGPAQLVELMPTRKPQKALSNEISAEQRAENKKRLQELSRIITKGE
jgi:hypothetical protein